MRFRKARNSLWVLLIVFTAVGLFLVLAGIKAIASDGLFKDAVVGLLVGAVFAGFGIYSCVSEVKRIKNNMFLKKSGTCICATATDVIMDKSVRVNRRYPDKLVCSYTDMYTGQEYHYYSEGVFGDLYSCIGMSADVYVDPSDLSNGYVDLKSLR